MPLYDYKCQCGCKGEFITGMNDYQVCPNCGQKMMRELPKKIYICMGAAGAHGYYDENLETYIHTNYQRREVMRQKGVTEKGATPKDGDAWI